MAEGKFLVLGLWDIHVHLSKIGETELPLFIANGVTSVRDMGSDFDEVDCWRREIFCARKKSVRRYLFPLRDSASISEPQKAAKVP